jgi:tetratricopeptide (TPR) repeat protein
MPPESAVAGHALSRGEPPSFRLVRGRPLADAVAEYRRRPSSLGLHDLLRRFVAACYEIAYAHGRGVTHLGLTPRRILLSDYGETAVVGWDHSPSAAAANGEPAAEADAYAAAFLAPEQAAGQADRVGPASDVYALGAVLYFFLSGQPPHDGTTAAEVLTRVREGLPWQPRMVAAGVPAALEAVCLTAMEREPAERYSSAADLAREIERWMAGERVRTNYVEPKGVRLARWARSRYGVLTLTGLLLASFGSLAVAVGVIRAERRYMADDTRKLVAAYHEAEGRLAEQVAQAHRDRAAASDEFVTAAQALEAVALKAQHRPDDPQAAYKTDLLRTALGAARQLAMRANIGGGADLPAARDQAHLGDLFLTLGQAGEARQHYERAVVLSRQTVKARPQDAVAQGQLAAAARALGRVCLQEGQTAFAGNLAHEAHEAAVVRAKIEPNNAMAKQEEATCLGLLADAAAARHDLPAARAALDRMVAVVESYAKADSPNLQDRFTLAAQYASRGALERLDHRYKDALAWYDRALAILRPLKAQGRLNAPLLALLGQLEQTADEYRTTLKAVDDINVALNAPEEKALRLLTDRAAALARLGRPAEAAITAEKMRE